jgi:hypothetical protein
MVEWWYVAVPCVRVASPAAALLSDCLPQHGGAEAARASSPWPSPAHRQAAANRIERLASRELSAVF